MLFSFFLDGTSIYVINNLLNFQKVKNLITKRNVVGLLRGIDNAFNTLVPWDGRIKRVESYFGSSVSSFFILLRWICYLNVCISILIIAFVTIPGNL